MKTLMIQGWGAAGKGTQINQLILPLDPRGFTVYTTKDPSEDEAMRPFLWRFWCRIPARGRMAIFDRSWYGRVLVERVEGIAALPHRGRDRGLEHHGQRLVHVGLGQGGAALEYLTAFINHRGLMFDQVICLVETIGSDYLESMRAHTSHGERCLVGAGVELYIHAVKTIDHVPVDYRAPGKTERIPLGLVGFDAYEITGLNVALVGMYAETSPACVWMIGRAVNEPVLPFTSPLVNFST